MIDRPVTLKVGGFSQIHHSSPPKDKDCLRMF